jgi:hypothetical protein
MAKRAKRPSGRGNERFLRDSGQIRAEINRGRRELQKALTPDQEALAVERVRGAESALMVLSRSRFEKLAQERTTTALRAMDDLVKLTQQKRYAIILTRQHCEIITGQLSARFEAVARALNATIESQAARSTVGVFVELSMFRQISQIQGNGATE